MAAPMLVALVGTLVMAAPRASLPDNPTAEEPALERVRLVADRTTPDLASRDVRLRGEDLGRTIRTDEFSMVGLSWRGDAPPALRLRVRDGAARWQAWHTPHVMTDGPDRTGNQAGESTGRTAIDLWWVERATAIQVRAAGVPRGGFTLTLMRGAPGDPNLGRETTEPSSHLRAKKNKPKKAPRPDLLGRGKWDANPKLRDGKPRYNRTIQQVHVHHTASSNRYRRSDVPGMLRGIYRYHTKNLGWSDIGYNFVVDKFGRTWVARAGGAGRPVRGAHTLGFNATSTGVAVLGNYEKARPNRKLMTAIVRLAAWKLDKYGRRAQQRVKVYSQGSDAYPQGSKPWLPTIDGHRDTNQTACPGKKLYAKLPNIRKATGERMRRF